MKKVYLSFFSILAASTLVAQVDNVTIKRESERVKPLITKSTPSKVLPAPQATNRVQYLTEDFEGTVPGTGWSIVSGPSSTVTDPNQEWHLQTTGGYPQNANPFDGTAAGGCLAVNYVNSVDQHDEWFISPAVALPNNACRVAFDFGTSVYWHATTLGGTYDNADIQVLVSTDGGTTWSAVLWQEDDLALLQAAYCDGYENLDPYAWSRAFVDLTPYQGQSVTLAWNYNGLDGAPFYLDNISVEDVPANEIAVLKGWSADVVQKWDYSMVPVAQTIPMRVGTVVRNLGGQTQTFDVTANIDFGGSSVYNSSVTLTQTPAQIDTVWFDSNYTPTALGNYTVTFTVPNDDDNNNNSRVANVETTSHTYAHDFTVAEVYGFDEDAITAIGNTFEMEANAALTAVDIKFETGTTPDIYVAINVWQVGQNIQDLTSVALQDYTVPAANIGSGNFTSIPFANPVNLVAGNAYVIEVQKVNPGTERLYVGGSPEGDEDLSTVCYGPFGTNNAVNWFIGWGFGAAVRASFDPTWGIEEGELAGVSIYPNPTNGVITITNSANTANVIEVMDVAGKVVATQNVNSVSTMDLSVYGSGVYFVKVSNETASMVEKVIVE